jgi:predicted lipoprotein with Yx(FWY)xxD motif
LREEIGTGGVDVGEPKLSDSGGHRMKRLPPARRSLPVKLLLLAAALVAVALTISACGGSSDSEATATMRGAAQGAGGTAVQMKAIGGAGPVLVDSSGQALYTSNVEEDGKVACVNACTSIWRPLAAGGSAPSASGSVEGDLGVVMRPDGTRQVSLDGKPLYSFTQEGPGEVTGDGFVDGFDGHEFTWSVVGAEGGAPEPSGSAAAAESSGSEGAYGY